MSNLLGKLGKNFVEGNKNIILSAMGKPLKPKRIWFGVTDFCNSHCTHCHIWANTEHAKPLTLEEIRKIFSDPILKDVESVVNSGGEATLRKDIAEIIKAEHEFFPKATLNFSTNGILPDRALEVTKEIMEAGICLEVSISLDGYGEKHDKIRGIPGNFEKVDYLIKKLKELKKEYPGLLKITAGFTLSRLTMDGYEELKKYIDDIEIDEFAIQWYNQSSFYSNNEDDEADIKKEMKRIVSSQPQSTTRERWLKLLENKPIKFECFAGRTFFVLKCDGTVSPCLTHWDAEFGNAREKSITEIWNSPEAKKARKVVAACPGCLNSWGLNWSLSANFYPRMAFFFRHPKEIFKRIKAGK